jgi:GAF domain-containing protein
MMAEGGGLRVWMGRRKRVLGGKRGGERKIQCAVVCYVILCCAVLHCVQEEEGKEKRRAREVKSVLLVLPFFFSVSF